MKRVLILERTDLCQSSILKEVCDIELPDFGKTMHETAKDIDIAIFCCDLKSEVKVLKNRYGSEKGWSDLKSTEDFTKMGKLILLRD
jgi:hypothetical protein